MKVAYLSYTYFADTDLSIVRELRKKVDLYYFIIITPTLIKTTAIDIKKQYPLSGIFKSNIYPEIEKFSGFIEPEKTFIVNIRGPRINPKNIWIFGKLLILLISLNIDILHTTMFYSATKFLLYFLRKKTFLTVHDPIPHSDIYSIRDFIYRKIAFYFLDNFLILNKNQKNNFISRYKLQRKKVYVSKLGVYDYLCRFTNIALQNKKDEYILFFGRITSYKGLDYLFPAMKKVYENKNVKLIVAGYCKKYYFDITEYQDCPYIKIVNKFLPDIELAVLIQNALFVVCPYIDATQSGVVMSAFAFNIPVLVTNVGGLSEYVDHKKSGYIVKPKDSKELANGINYLLEHRELLEEQKKYIYDKYKKGDNSWEKITDDFITYYRKSSISHIDI